MIFQANELSVVFKIVNSCDQQLKTFRLTQLNILDLDNLLVVVIEIDYI